MTKTNQQQINLKNKREEKKNQSCSSIMLWPHIDNSQKGINFKATEHSFCHLDYEHLYLKIYYHDSWVVCIEFYGDF